MSHECLDQPGCIPTKLRCVRPLIYLWKIINVSVSLLKCDCRAGEIPPVSLHKEIPTQTRRPEFAFPAPTWEQGVVVWACNPRAWEAQRQAEPRCLLANESSRRLWKYSQSSQSFRFKDPVSRKGVGEQCSYSKLVFHFHMQVHMCTHTNNLKM